MGTATVEGGVKILGRHKGGPYGHDHPVGAGLVSAQLPNNKVKILGRHKGGPYGTCARLLNKPPAHRLLPVMI